MSSNESPAPQRARWTALGPEMWRSDLLRIVLRSTSTLGAIVYLPSFFLALKSGLHGIAALDTAALATLLALTCFDRIPATTRAACGCSVFYALGVGLMVGVGSISQIYLLGFSFLTTLLLGVRWGLATVVLNAVTMLAIGYVGFAAPEMTASRWTMNYVGWSVVTGNFVFVNASLVLVLGAVIQALETALGRAVASRKALEHEQKELVKLNHSLEEEVSERARNEASLRAPRRFSSSRTRKPFAS